MTARPAIRAAGAVLAPALLCSCASTRHVEPAQVSPSVMTRPHPVTPAENGTLDGYDPLLQEMADQLSDDGQVTTTKTQARRHFADTDRQKCWLQSAIYHTAGVDTATDDTRHRVFVHVNASLIDHKFPLAQPDNPVDDAAVAFISRTADRAEFHAFGRGDLTYYVQLPLPWTECA